MEQNGDASFEVKKEAKEVMVSPGIRMKQEVIMEDEEFLDLPSLQPDPEGMYHCTECDFVGTDISTLNHHWKSKHIEIRYFRHEALLNEKLGLGH